MGEPKHQLRFGEQTALEKIVAEVNCVVDHLVVVKSPTQSLDLSSPRMAGFSITNDRVPGQGPLEGLACGFAALPPEVGAIFACSCDLPLLSSEVVGRLFSRVDGVDAVVPIDEQRYHALTAVYTRQVQPVIERLLEQGRRRMTELVDQLSVRMISVERFRDIDPQLWSFRNVNTPEDYAEAVRLCSD